jgi:hypothetical protein
MEPFTMAIGKKTRNMAVANLSRQMGAQFTTETGRTISSMVEETYYNKAPI